jgi:hypothetical protein
MVKLYMPEPILIIITEGQARIQATASAITGGPILHLPDQKHTIFPEIIPVLREDQTVL